MKAVESKRSTTAKISVAIDPAEVVDLLRSTVLNLTLDDIDSEPSDVSAKVWGVVIETGHPDAVATLVALVDGSVSLYVSDGSGCVGCGARREVRYAAADMLEMAERCLGRSTPTDDRSAPPAGNARFYFLSIHGLSAVQVPVEELNTDAELGALYFAGQRVINAIERAGAGQSIEHEIRLAEAEMQSLALSTSAKRNPACLSVGNAVHRLQR